MDSVSLSPPQPKKEDTVAQVLQTLKTKNALTVLGILVATFIAVIVAINEREDRQGQSDLAAQQASSLAQQQRSLSVTETLSSEGFLLQAIQENKRFATPLSTSMLYCAGLEVMANPNVLGGDSKHSCSNFTSLRKVVCGPSLVTTGAVTLVSTHFVVNASTGAVEIYAISASGSPSIQQFGSLSSTGVVVLSRVDSGGGTSSRLVFACMIDNKDNVTGPPCQDENDTNCIFTTTVEHY